jgi:hypothetical protein
LSGLVDVYVSVGNSDDKLTQARWFRFHEQVTSACRQLARRIYGDWQSPAVSPFQNACIAFGIEPADIPALKLELADLAGAWGQDAIAWAEVTTKLLRPPAATSE